MRRTRWLIMGGTLAAVAGCGGPSPAEQVRATLAGFAHATAQRDYQALCDRYFAPRLVAQVEDAGLPCEAAIRPEISSTVNPSLTIHGVQVDGDRATARVHTSADNQPPSDDTIALQRVRGEWRIVALAQAGPQPAAP